MHSAGKYRKGARLAGCAALNCGTAGGDSLGLQAAVPTRLWEQHAAKDRQDGLAIFLTVRLSIAAYFLSKESLDSRSPWGVLETL